MDQHDDRRDEMTVGEFAQMMGVTVRTLQYYDLKGVLSPSGKGPGNQRLYSAADADRLRRVMVLKYLGLSLSQIRDAGDGLATPAELRGAVDKSRDDLDEQVMQVFERMSALRNMSQDLAASPQDDPVDWGHLMGVVSESQHDVKGFWSHLTEDDRAIATSISRDEVLAWHALMGETVEAMQAGEKPEGKRAQELAGRFSELGGMPRAMEGLAAPQGHALGKPGHAGPHASAGPAGPAGGQAAGPDAVANAPSQHEVHGRDFYHKLQERTLGFLQQALDLRKGGDAGTAGGAGATGAADSADAGGPGEAEADAGEGGAR